MASILFECYHPITHLQSMTSRIELLKYFHENEHGLLVTGSEDGKDYSIPYCYYFEGMMSPGSFMTYSGLSYYHEDIPWIQSRSMLNESLRVPLFELAFHDCVVSYWYWGDHNSKLIPLWYYSFLYVVPKSLG
ncbi:Carbohydrate binding domain-containing protein [Histomonas meleagridis]|uniref:Carbohydrate binding domain-containing protein n=1 Tax=Histomonas meleagridis TaxID=135588 RepID=UPI0035593B25|nr:Carbohydrate binding domain-containing protein [Histomonas meleagridis]KAH0797335.1 Carbohydrate binding domain-containing protein [Histomonas meleagridis]